MEFQARNTFPSEKQQLCSRVFWLPVKKSQTILTPILLRDLFLFSPPPSKFIVMHLNLHVFSYIMDPFNLEIHVFLFNWKFLFNCFTDDFLPSVFCLFCVCDFFLLSFSLLKEISLSRCWISWSGPLIFFLIF